MNRKSLILAAQGQNTNGAIETLIRKDLKFLERQIEQIGRDIEDTEEALELRLSASEPIDAAVVQVDYKNLMSLYEKGLLYEAFKADYFSEDENMTN